MGGGEDGGCCFKCINIIVHSEWVEEEVEGVHYSVSSLESIRNA